MKRQKDQPDIADPKSQSSIPPNPEPFNLFAGLESQDLLQPANPSTISQPLPQAGQNRPAENPPPTSTRNKSNRSLLIALIVIAALILGVIIGSQIAH